MFGGGQTPGGHPSRSTPRRGELVNHPPGDAPKKSFSLIACVSLLGYPRSVTARGWVLFAALNAFRATRPQPRAVAHLSRRTMDAPAVEPVFEYCAQVIHTHELAAGQAVKFVAPAGWESEPSGWFSGDAVVQLSPLDLKRARMPALFVVWRRRKEA